MTKQKRKERIIKALESEKMEREKYKEEGFSGLADEIKNKIVGMLYVAALTEIITLKEHTELVEKYY